MSASSNVRTSSTPATTSSLRPRPRRLISGLDEGDETELDPSITLSTRIASPLPSPFESRSASPIPPSHLSRPSSSRKPQKTADFASLGGKNGVQWRINNESTGSLAGLWGNSWSTLQGIASDLLGNDVSTVAASKDSTRRARRPLSKANDHRSSTSAPPSQWGPTLSVSTSTGRGIGAGTREDQVAAFRAKKRRDLLANQGSSYADALGKFKRRSSDDRASMSAPPGENEDRDALVYVHHVQKNDTLAGITIKYNCSASVLRKANRMWPNDTVQMRDTIILPVDACAVKGKVMTGAQVIDLLGTESEALSAGLAEEVPTPLARDGDGVGSGRAESSSFNTTRRPSSSFAGSSADGEPPWQHDSWVLLPGSTKATEIGRLSRKALGYFPPARRKSNSYSDFDTPSTSLDLARAVTNDLASHPALSPLRPDPPQRSPRSRRLSNAGNGYFPSYMAGPGGVGTMNRNVHYPGPAQDGLNKLFAKHLPDVAPPRSQQVLLTPEMPFYTDGVTPSASGATTPNLNKNYNLENVGGAIESWMRRLASKAKTSMESDERQRAARASVGTPGLGAGGVGDLIEMTDEFEIGGDDDDDLDEGRGRRGSVVHVGNSTTGASHSDGGVRERGASHRAASNPGKSGKAD